MPPPLEQQVKKCLTGPYRERQVEMERKREVQTEENNGKENERDWSFASMSKPSKLAPGRQDEPGSKPTTAVIIFMKQAIKTGSLINKLPIRTSFLAHVKFKVMNGNSKSQHLECV
ncbi:hypothetical protein Y1Q_0013499 [Alligator mississippiensis]|uniref:Uncharacterized protein n=1 Tax=Alligator mississippiensis TaxID=8496 RepID=A0A151P2Y3_ALLMI|nr:hypothetical protein Y1Q_0013499 [Alligator mississippiensis]